MTKVSFYFFCDNLFSSSPNNAAFHATSATILFNVTLSLGLVLPNYRSVRVLPPLFPLLATSFIAMVAIKKTALPKKPPPTQRRRLFVPSRPSSDAAAGPSAPLRNKGDLEEAIEAMADARGCKSATISDYTLRCRKMFKEDTGSEQVTGRDNRRFTRSANFLDTTVTSKEETKARPSDADKLLARKPKPSPFDVSPQKKNQKPIKLNLDDSEVKPAPKRWRQQLEVLSRQRKRIIAPVDEMGCEENGRDDRRADAWRREDEQEKLKRERFTVLVSLMLSSQTKDETTAQAVKNLQSNLPLGLSLQGILTATDDEISSNINKVGFWRRKTGYIKSAASIIASTFNGDVPKNVDELCSLPGVGPKMAFLCLQSAWQINLGIGVDVHVHRLSNRLGWCKTNDPEATRLVLQSWLPKKVSAPITHSDKKRPLT